MFVVIMPLAEEDLAEIWAWIAVDDMLSAYKFVRELHSYCLQLADRPPSAGGAARHSERFLREIR